MREIKFRGKCLDSGTWLCGSLFDRIWRKSSDGSRVCYIFNDSMIDDDNGGGDSWEDFADVAEQYEVDPATVGQYTGLKDGDGKEIYEGDILECIGMKSDNLGKVYRRDVVFYKGSFSMNVPNLQVKSALQNHMHYNSDKVGWAVIGNIHDNPELLNV